ncbi:MAG: ATP-binding protein [Bacteroidota bacterium]
MTLHAAVPERRMDIESRTERLMEVREFVSSAARAFGFSEDEAGKIALAADEACTNIIKHAYAFDPAQKIAITIQDGPEAFEILISDSGRYFDPDAIPAPDMKEYLSHYRRGGLGVYLMRALMDRVEYTIVPGQRNQVRLVKYLRR